MHEFLCPLIAVGLFPLGFLLKGLYHLHRSRRHRMRMEIRVITHSPTPLALAEVRGVVEPIEHGPPIELEMHLQSQSRGEGRRAPIVQRTRRVRYRLDPFYLRLETGERVLVKPTPKSISPYIRYQSLPSVLPETSSRMLASAGDTLGVVGALSHADADTSQAGGFREPGATWKLAPTQGDRLVISDRPSKEVFAALAAHRKRLGIYRVIVGGILIAIALGVASACAMGQMNFVFGSSVGIISSLFVAVAALQDNRIQLELPHIDWIKGVFRREQWVAWDEYKPSKPSRLGSLLHVVVAFLGVALLIAVVLASAHRRAERRERKHDLEAAQAAEAARELADEAHSLTSPMHHPQRP